MTVYHFIVFCSVFVAALAQMALKKGAMNNYDSMLREYLNVWVIGGYALMMVSLLTDVWAISKGVQVKEVSIIESVSYLFVPVLGALFFKEKISPRKAMGVALILGGIVVFFL